MSVCLALHTGFVVVGEIGDGRPSTIVGNLTVAVEALQEHRLPGVLLCSDATARLIRDDARLEEAAPVSLSGESGSIRTYKVTGPSPRAPSHALVNVRTLSPFVGRGHELSALHGVLDRVADGRGQSVGIVGEPGIGKSRLLFEFSQQLHRHGPVTYLEGHCLSYAMTTPYSLVLEVLRAHRAIASADGDDVIADKVHRTLEVLGVNDDRTAPYLLHLLGVMGADTLCGTSPGTLKAHTFAALKQLWIKSSQRRLLVIAIEDLHWIDPTSEEFVTTLVDALPGAPVLLLATYRPGYRPSWMEKSYTTQLPVPPLSATDSAQVVHAVLHQERAPSPLADAVLAKAQGNPFFLEELARMLVQRQIPADVSADRSDTPPQPIDSHLPPNVEAVIGARIDRLSIAAKHLRQTAAVVGVDVPISLLRLVAGLTETAFNAHLAELEAAELLNENHRFRDAAYTFKHALTQEVTYASLLNQHRRELHARILDALETLALNRDAERDFGAGQSYSRPQYLEQLAYHAVRGEAWADGVVYSRQAGEKARARSAHREAVSYFEQAIHALAHLPDTRDTREQAIDLRLALRSALHPCGELRRAMTCVGEAEVFANALDDPLRLAEVSLALSLHCYLSGAYTDAIAAATRVATLTPDTDSDQRLRAALHMAIAYQARGDYHRAIDCLSTMAARLHEATGRTRWGELVPAVFIPAYLAACHAELGAFVEGTSIGNSGLEIAEAENHPMSHAFAAWGAGLVALRQGKLSTAASVLERVVNLYQDDRPAWFPLLAAALGATYTGTGHIDDGRVLLRQGLDLAVATEIVANQAVCSVGLANAELQARRSGLSCRPSPLAGPCSRRARQRSVRVACARRDFRAARSNPANASCRSLPPGTRPG
jgi:tetratricopeptide (TPR) repeat protein